MRYVRAPAGEKDIMPSDPKPPPSAEEIQAYLELSAARTKKRLTLAAGNARPAPAAARTDRKLPTRPEKAVETPAAPPEAVPGAEASDASWRPFTDDDKR